MVGDEGEKKSSEAVTDPPGASAPVAASRSVFLSYASHDADVAESICEYLESRGILCWMAPRDVPGGALYADAIVRAINEAKALVVVLSQSAVVSSHVGKEIERASSKKKKILAFRVDPAPLTPALEYFLSESQWIDVPALGMPGALAKLTEAVRQGSVGTSASDPVFGTGGGRVSGGSAVNRAVGTATVGKRAVVAAAIIVVFGIGCVLAVHFWLSKHGNAQAPTIAAVSDKSIAVLPFADMSQKKDQEYFGDGMAEEILDLLAKIPGLTVIGRTSSFQFKGKNEDLRKIGTELNAAYVLEGSVRDSGDQVRVTVQLISTRTGAHEWSETYDRPIGDVLKLQDAIAAAVVRELQLTVDPGYLPSRSTLKSADTYDLILRGRHAADRWDKEGLDEAVALFRQALERDPTSADAAAELAFAHYRLGADSFLAPAAAFEPARREAAAALQLDPKNVLAHLVLSRISMAYDWDWSASEHELQKVNRLAPGSADGLNGEAHLFVIMGRWDDALRLINAALAQDPMDANSFQFLALIQARRGHLPEAEAAIRRALDIRPTYAYGHYYLGLLLLERGNHEPPLLEMEQETTDDGKQAGLAMVYYALGRKEESDAALARLVQERADVDAFMVAAVFAFRGQLDEAMHWLERAYVQKDASLFSVKFDLPLKNLEKDPRYKAFLKKMNLPE